MMFSYIRRTVANVTIELYCYNLIVTRKLVILYMTITFSNSRLLANELLGQCTAMVCIITMVSELRNQYPRQSVLSLWKLYYLLRGIKLFGNML